MINAVSQFLQLCRSIGIKFLLWTCSYTTIKFLGKHVIQTNPSKFDKRLFSERERERERERGGGREQNSRVKVRTGEYVTGYAYWFRLAAHSTKSRVDRRREGFAAVLQRTPRNLTNVNTYITTQFLWHVPPGAGRRAATDIAIYSNMPRCT